MDDEPYYRRLQRLFSTLRGLQNLPSEKAVLSESETGTEPSADEAQGER